MKSYKAPAHTTEIFLSTGPYRVNEEGCVVVPDDLPQADVIALCGAGFTPTRAKTPAKAKAE